MQVIFYVLTKSVNFLFCQERKSTLVFKPCAIEKTRNGEIYEESVQSFICISSEIREITEPIKELL